MFSLLVHISMRLRLLGLNMPRSSKWRSELQKSLSLKGLEVIPFIQSCLGPDDLKYLHKQAHEVDTSGVAKEKHKLQATAYQQTVDKKWKAESAQKAAVDMKRAKIDAIVPRLDTQSITSKPDTNPKLNLQLEWHRWLDSEKLILRKKNLTQKDDKVAALVAAVKQYNEGAVHAPADTEDVEMLAEVPSDLDKKESDWEH